MADLAVVAIVLAAHMLLQRKPSCSVGVGVECVRDELSRVKEHFDVGLPCRVANGLQGLCLPT